MQDKPASRPKRTVEFSKTETAYLLKYEDINGAGRLFGGRLLSWIDENAAMTARRHAGIDVTTAAMDNLVFKRGAYLNDIIVLISRVTFVGHKSLEVRVDTYLEDADGMRTPINRAYLTYVCVDSEGHTLAVPYDIEPVTEGEKMEYEAAKKRRENRAYRRREGF